MEFDWLGVLIGPDLRYEGGKVVGDPAKRAKTDSSLKGWKKALTAAKGDEAATAAVHEKVQAIIKNTYKVLLSRGRKGCFVWCEDAALRDYLRDRLRLATRTFADGVAGGAVGGPATTTPVVYSEPEGEPFVDCLPVYDLKAAASEFGPSVTADCLGWMATPKRLKPDGRYFVAQVFGRSMEPLIPHGSYCVFRQDVAGTRRGKTLLVQHWVISDPETGGAYTVKDYHSLKVEDLDAGDDRSWQHTAIQLAPRNKDFAAIWINPDQVDDLRVIAEFVQVISAPTS